MKLFDRIKEFLNGNGHKKLRCPNCGGADWYEGPSGGISTNIMCRDCGHWYNYHQGIAPMDDLHQVGIDRRGTRSNG